MLDDKYYFKITGSNFMPKTTVNPSPVMRVDKVINVMLLFTLIRNGENVLLEPLSYIIWNSHEVFNCPYTFSCTLYFDNFSVCV